MTLEELQTALPVKFKNFLDKVGEGIYNAYCTNTLNYLQKYVDYEENHFKSILQTKRCHLIAAAFEWSDTTDNIDWDQLSSDWFDQETTNNLQATNNLTTEL